MSPHGPEMDGTVIRLDDGEVTEVVTADRQGAYFDFRDTYKTTNVYKMAPDLWALKLHGLLRWYTEAIGKQSYYENVIGMITYATRGQLKAMVISPSAWREVDDPNDLRRANWGPPFGMGDSDPRADHGGWWGVAVTDFPYIRNMYFPPPALVARLRARVEEALHNYGSSQEVLDSQMAWFLDTEPEDTVALPGASAGLAILASMMDQNEVCIPEPSFGEYARLFPRAETYRVDQTRVNLQAILDQRPEVIVVVNPNNPTGDLIPTPLVAEAARENPETRFLVDESFLPFTDEPSMRNPQMDAGRNVIVLASLGKWLGAPGLRMGYLWCRDQETTRAVRERLPVWAANSMAEMFMEGLLKFRPEIAESVHQTGLDRANFAERLNGVGGVECSAAGGGNFLVAHLVDISPDRSQQVCTALLSAGFLVKDVTARLAVHHVALRLAVRTPADNEALAGAVERILPELRSRA